MLSFGNGSPFCWALSVVILIEVFSVNSVDKWIKKNVLALLILAVVFMIGLHFFGRYRLSRTPPFLLTKLDQLMNRKDLMDSIGGSQHFSYDFNKNDFKLRDTVKYSIKIIGKKKILFYTAVHIRENDATNEWRLTIENLTIQ